MAYDHHRKAGNQGDCVKHPPLIAALDAVLQVGNKEPAPFHYLDVFAGHAWHPLMDGKEYEWKKGIGKLASRNVPDDVPPAVKCWWDIWHDSPSWPATTPPGYPGSSWIAAHRCRNAKRGAYLELYDHSEEVRRDLERAFPSSHAISCLIAESLNYKQRHAEQADFVFIDPPGWHTKEHPCYPKWSDILDHILRPRGANARPTLMWMPAGGQERTPNKNGNGENPGAYPWDEKSNGDSHKRCDKVRAIGHSWTAVRWGKSSFDACMLVYNCAEAEIRAAVDSIVQIAGSGWEVKHSD